MRNREATGSRGNFSCCVFAHTVASSPVVPRMKRSSKKAFPRPNAMAREAKVPLRERHWLATGTWGCCSGFRPSRWWAQKDAATWRTRERLAASHGWFGENTTGLLPASINFYLQFDKATKVMHYTGWCCKLFFLCSLSAWSNVR